MPGKNEFEAIIVGSGPGGASVAVELARRGVKPLILERGGEAPVKGTFFQAVSQLGVPGKSLFFTGGMLALVRGITLGGSSVFYYHTAFEPPLDRLKKYGLDISTELEEIKAELPIAPLSDALMGPMAGRLMESARETGLDWKRLPKLLYQEKCKPNCDLCTYGCPYEAKFNARMLIEEARSKGAVLESNAAATGFFLENGRVGGVNYMKAGRPKTAFAPMVIIAAGGIGTPRILRAGGLKKAGRNFFYDPLIAVMGEVDGIRGGREIPMAAGCLMEDQGFMITDMTLPLAVYLAFTAQALRPDRLTSHSRTLTMMVKVRDDLGGYITDRGGVNKPLAPADRAKLQTGRDLAVKILKNAGARNIHASRPLASHPGGTAKTGELVDANLETEIPNLYVCDCSIIPEAWGLPPTLTLLALGKRLAKHLTA